MKKAVILLGLVLASPIGATESSSRMIQIFEQICIDGTGRFADGELRPVSAGSIPSPARQIVLLNLWPSRYDYEEHRFASRDEMPSQVFRVRGDDSGFLIVADENPSNPIQASCGVLVDSDRYAEFAGFAATLTGQELPDLEKANAMVALPYGEHRVTVARGFRRLRPEWTFIAVTPAQAFSVQEHF